MYYRECKKNYEIRTFHYNGIKLYQVGYYMGTDFSEFLSFYETFDYDEAIQELKELKRKYNDT